MNADEAIQLFCRKNLKILTSTDLSREDLKGLVKDFFYTKHSNRFGQPSSKDIQVGLIRLLQKNGITIDEIISIINKAQLFSGISDSLRQQLLELLSQKEFNSTLSDSQIDTIKKIGAFRALEKSKGDEIEQQKQSALEELDRQIESKRQEYASLPSVLDEPPVEEPEFEPAAEETKPWWERFYLKSDPFPRKDGLSAIAEDMYDAVISKTAPFIATLGSLERDPQCLFYTGFLLVGGYGYGKTTFIDYLSHHLINTGVLPIRITCTRCSADASGFADSFFHRLRKTLLDEAGKMTRVDTAQLADLEVEDQITELVKTISARKRGVIIFMDDYHKFASHFTQIYEFLGTLQVFKDSLTRKELPVGFVVSGIPEWREELDHNTQLSGFLDGTPIEMPDVGAPLVCEVFNRRIRAYCYEATPRLIRSVFVEKLVVEFAGKAGLRDYIGKIVSELSHNNYAIVDSPIEISEQQLADAKLLIEADSHLKTGLTRLVFGSAFKRFTQEQVAKTLELLVHIGMQAGITESDRQFIPNRFYFQTLRDCGLIQKQRGKTGGVSWGLHVRLLRVAEVIHRKHGLSLQDYLLKLYAYKGYSLAARSTAPANAELNALKHFFGSPQLKLSTSVSQNIALGLRILDSLTAPESNRRKDADNVTSAYVALTAFSEALFTLDNAILYFNRAGLRELSVQWEMHPDNDEILTEAFSRYRDFQQEKTPHRLALALKQLKEAAYLTAHTLKRLLEEQTSSTGAPLLHRPLAHAEEELRIFTAVAEGKYSTRGQDHFDYIRRVTDWLELRFRTFFYFTGNLSFGHNYIEQCPRSVVNYAYKNLETRVVYNTVDNRFEGLTRSQYRQIISEGNPFKEFIVDQLSLEWKSDDWTLFGELFAELNIDTAHLQISAFDVTQRSRYLRYCAMAEEITTALNDLVANTIEKSAYICPTTPTTRKPEEVLFRFDFRSLPLKDVPTKVLPEWPRQFTSNSALKDHTLSADAFDRVKGRLQDKIENSPSALVVIDLLNIEYLADHYRVSLVELICALVFIRHFDHSLLVQPWMGSSILVQKNSSPEGTTTPKTAT